LTFLQKLPSFLTTAAIEDMEQFIVTNFKLYESMR